MTFFVECAIQTCAILLIALLSLLLLRKRSAAIRHCVLSAALLFAAITPVLKLVLPVRSLTPIMTDAQVEVVVPRTTSFDSGRSAVSAEAVAGDRESAISSWREQLLRIYRWLPGAIWLGGLSIGLLVMFTGLIRLARIASFSYPMPNLRWFRLAATVSDEYGIRRFVDLLQSRNQSILITWGVFRPKVILPLGADEWREERARVVLLHELAHVRRRDWLVQMVAQLLRAIYWFNPLVWIVCHRLRVESERACDDAVLSKSVTNHEYAAHLVELARVLNTRGRSWSAALAVAHSSTIERRFAAMLNPALDRRPATRFAILSTAVVGACVTLPLVMLTGAAPLKPLIATLPSAIVEKAEVAASTAQQSPQPKFATAAPAKPQPKPSQIPAPVPNLAQTDPQPLQDNLVKVKSVSATLREFISRSVGAQRALVSAQDRALYEAAESGDIPQMDSLIRGGANVNAPVPGDGSPLIGAARRGRLEAVRFLLDRGADPNMPVRGDGNPLIMAARSGHIDVVTLLLDRGAGVDQIVPGDENAVISASRFGRLEVVKLLVSRGADVNVRVQIDPSPWYPIGETRTALSEARKGQHQAIVDFLVSVGARE